MVFAEMRNFDDATCTHLGLPHLNNFAIAAHEKTNQTKTESHRGWRNISRLEAHPSQSLGQLHCVHPTVRGHVRLTPNMHVHFAHYREEKGMHTQKGAESTCTARENSSSQQDDDRGLLRLNTATFSSN